MSVTPTLHIDNGGRVFFVEPGDTLEKNAVLVTVEGRPYAVTVDSLSDPVWVPTRPPLGADNWLAWWYADGSVGVAERMPGTEPQATTLTVERSVDGGRSWRLVALNVEAHTLFETVDWEGLSRGDTLYRVTAFAATGASAETVANIPADSNAAWLAAGPDFSSPAKTLYNPGRGQDAGRDRAAHTVLGRERPVAFAGEQLSDTISASGRIVAPNLGGEVTATREDLIRVVQDGYPIHLYRDQEGTHVYAMVGAVKFSRVVAGVTDWSLSLTQVAAPDEEEFTDV